MKLVCCILSLECGRKISVDNPYNQMYLPINISKVNGILYFLDNAIRIYVYMSIICI